jgi:hypothetical protein
VLKVYESKTNKWWEADLTWLDPEVVEVFDRYYKEKGSIIEAITGIDRVGKFKRWYGRLLEKVSELLGLPFRLVPHDLRRSHLSILAELEFR